MSVNQFNPVPKVYQKIIKNRRPILYRHRPFIAYSHRNQIEHFHQSIVGNEVAALENGRFGHNLKIFLNALKLSFKAPLNALTPFLKFLKIFSNAQKAESERNRENRHNRPFHSHESIISNNQVSQ